VSLPPVPARYRTRVESDLVGAGRTPFDGVAEQLALKFS
jgi:hypothetical protein